MGVYTWALLFSGYVDVVRFAHGLVVGIGRWDQAYRGVPCRCNRAEAVCADPEGCVRLSRMVRHRLVESRGVCKR